MDIEPEAAIRGIEERVGPLPPAYRDYLLHVGRGSTRHFRRTDGSRWGIHFYRPALLLNDMPASVADERDGLLAIGSLGPSCYVLEVRTGRLYLWDSDENEFADGVERLQLVSDDITRFLSDLEPEPTPAPEDPLQTLARSAPIARIEMFLDATSDPASVEKLAKYAAREGRIDVVDSCLRRGCETRWLAAFAIRGGHLAMVRHLVEQVGLDPTPALNERVLSTPEVRAYLAERYLRRP